MKKFISIILVFTLCLSLVACAVNTENTDADSKEPVLQNQATCDSVLLDKLDEWVNTTQPGTAGSSLKAFNAMKDVVIWAQNNAPDKETIVATVEEYLENCPYKDEAVDAFISMKNIFGKITDGTIQDMMDGIEVDMSNYEVDAEMEENIRMLFSAVEEYVNKQQ